MALYYAFRDTGMCFFKWKILKTRKYTNNTHQFVCKQSRSKYMKIHKKIRFYCLRSFTVHLSWNKVKLFIHMCNDNQNNHIPCHGLIMKMITNSIWNCRDRQITPMLWIAVCIEAWKLHHVERKNIEKKYVSEKNVFKFWFHCWYYLSIPLILQLFYTCLFGDQMF